MHREMIFESIVNNLTEIGEEELFQFLLERRNKRISSKDLRCFGPDAGMVREILRNSNGSTPNTGPR